MVRFRQDRSDHHKRPQGALEAAITKVLLDSRRPMNAGEVRTALADQLQEPFAYSTVVTILTRLHEKHVLTRTRDGRAFRYSPVTDQVGLEAQRLQALLDSAPDRDAVLTRFVGALPEHDEDVLRRLLNASTPPKPEP